MTRQAGFTLVELVIVIMVIGALTVYAAPRFDRSGYDAAAAADEVVEAIRYAQVLAMQHSGRNDANGNGNADYYGFRIASSGFTVAIADSVTDVAAVPNQAGTGSYIQSWSGGITLSPNATIYFNALGEPIDAAGNSLGTGTTINVTSGSTTVPVTVERLTGYAYR